MNHKAKHNYKINKIFLIILLSLFCFSCQPPTTIAELKENSKLPILDPDDGMTKDEVKYSIERDRRDIKKDKGKPSELQLKESQENIPSISKLLISPPPPPIGNGRLISFSVTEEVPLKDVIIELGRIADIDIEVDPKISGGIILKVKQKPLDIIIDRICELGGLRYSYTDNILRFEKDLPYNVNYTIDFLVNDTMWSSIQTSIQNILANSGDTETKIDINKPASIITVYANSKAQKKITEYLKEAKRNYSAQVLIEAKILEVELNDEYSAGIDWTFLNTSTTPDSFTITNATTPEKGLISGVLANDKFGGDLTTTLKALETFGTTKTLSSPRIHAINNQEAKLEFTNTLVYFSVERDVTAATDTTAQITEYTTTKEEDTEGITLTITPSINLDTQEITLDVVPELRVSVGTVEDPNPDIENEVPLIQIRKMTTSLKLKSGGVMVIGGLMSESTANTETAVPLLNKIPILGYLFRAKDKDAQVTETVIFLKATIVDSEGNVDKYDKEFYETFSPERRPLL